MNEPVDPELMYLFSSLEADGLDLDTYQKSAMADLAKGECGKGGFISARQREYYGDIQTEFPEFSGREIEKATARMVRFCQNEMGHG